MENLNEQEPIKKRKKGLILGIIILILIIAILGGGYFWYNTTSKASNIYLNQIYSAIDSISAENEYETLDTTLLLSGNIETEDKEIKEIAQYINEAKITFNVQADYKAKTETINLGLNYQNEDLLKAQVYYAEGDDNLYLYVNDLFDKYFKINLKELEQNGELTSEMQDLFADNKLTLGQKINMEKSKKILKNEIKLQLSESYFSQEKVDDTVKSTMKLTASQLKNILTQVCNNLQNNQEFLDCYENPNEIKETLSEYVTTINEETEYDALNIEMAIYTKGIFVKELVKVEVNVYDESNNKVTVTVNKIDDENYEYSFTTISVEDDMNYNITGTLKLEEISENNGKCIITMNVPEVGTITLNLEANVIENETITSVDVSNNVDINNLTDNDAMTLFTNLQNMKIYQLIVPTMY